MTGAVTGWRLRIQVGRRLGPAVRVLGWGDTVCAGPLTDLAPLFTARFLVTRTRSLRVAQTGDSPRHTAGCPAAVAPPRAEAFGVTRPRLCLVPTAPC